jgi:hypothetical protein
MIVLKKEAIDRAIKEYEDLSKNGLCLVAGAMELEREIRDCIEEKRAAGSYMQYEISSSETKSGSIEYITFWDDDFISIEGKL